MTIKLELPRLTDITPRILVMGVGGAGGNAINNMIASGLKGVDFVAANTDAQALSLSSAERRLQLGVNLTEGLGAGAKPEIGQAAAEEALEDIRSELSGAHMVFIAAGMGGGTGTGAASVIANCARDMGILTVGIVSKPFHFEGSRRMRIADEGINGLRAAVDTLIVIPNQNLFSIANERTTFAESFVLADQVLYSGIACIVDLILKDGLINLDFADVRAVMADMGSAVMGTGEAEGSQRAVMAAEEAIANPLLEDVSLSDAQGVLISIVGGPDMTLYEVDEAANRIRQEVDTDANIIVGATFDPEFEDRLRVSLVAAGMDRTRGLRGPRAEDENDGLNTRGVVSAGSAEMNVAAAVDAPAATAPQPTATADSEALVVSAAPVPADAGPKPLSALPPPLPDRAIGATTAPVVPDQSLKPGGTNAQAEARADAFARALDEAQPQAPPPPQHTQPSPSSAPNWQSANGVTIEPIEAHGLERSAEPEAKVTKLDGASASPPDHAPQFEPAMPHEARAAQPRFPNVDAFPPHAQREFHAKSGEPGTTNVANAPRAQRGGLFGRLSGSGGNGESPATDSGGNGDLANGTGSSSQQSTRKSA